MEPKLVTLRRSYDLPSAGYAHETRGRRRRSERGRTRGSGEREHGGVWESNLKSRSSGLEEVTVALVEGGPRMQLLVSLYSCQIVDNVDCARRSPLVFMWRRMDSPAWPSVFGPPVSVESS